MPLSSELISQFVKVTNDKTEEKKESIVYGTVKERDGSTFVIIDGSEILTPVTTTADLKDKDRVTVMIKNHTAVVTGNVTNCSAGVKEVGKISETVKDASNQISQFEILLADKVDTEQLNAEKARIDTLVADNATIKGKVSVNEADIVNLKAKDATIEEKLTTNEADIKYLKANMIGADYVDATFVTTEEFDATNAEVHNLEATYAAFAKQTTDDLTAKQAAIDDLESKKLSAEAAELTYANIDFSNIGEAAMEYFYATSGLIRDVVVGDGTITGHLIGVTISGDLIEANTVKAEKLVIRGTDGLYYKLNTDGMTTEAEQTDQNSLNGSIIKAKSITATKISVSDLVAFDATIGGFNITDNSLYSGVKSTVNNTTRGIYLDSEGQMAVGDASNFIKYYKDTNGAYKLEISADSLTFGSNKKSVEAAINDVQTSVDSIQVGGRNLFRNSKDCSGWVHNDIVTFEPAEEDGFTIINFGDVTAASYNKVTPVPNVPYSVVRNKTITISLYVRADDNRMDSSYYNSILCSIGIATSATGGRTKYKDYWLKDAEGYYALSTEWEKRSLTLNITDSVFSSGTGEITDDSYFTVSFYRYNLAGAQLKAPKLEIGNRATDWTPSPDDMATTGEVEEVASAVERTQSRVSDAEALIEVLSESISMLVTDGNGASLMTQTENGWAFSTGEIQELVDRTSENLNTLTNDVGDVNNAVDILQQAVDDLGTIAEYIKITTYEDEPCIELGEGDSDFKLRITNTRMMFTEGSAVLAYFTNKSMHIQKAVIEEELQQGSFVWKVRSNGNMGLVWKGVTN